MSKTTSNMNTHMTTGGTQVPAERLNEWGYPAQEFYFFAGNGLWTEVNPNEKTATQLRKEKKHTVDNSEAAKMARTLYKDDLIKQCARLGLSTKGTKADLATRVVSLNALLRDNKAHFVEHQLDDDTTEFFIQWGNELASDFPDAEDRLAAFLIDILGYIPEVFA